MKIQPFIDFEWERDPEGRFELVPERRVPNPQKGKPLGGLAAGMGLIDDSEWKTEGGYISWSGGSAPRQRYRPLETSGLVEMFAAIKKPEDVLRFVKTFGLLTEWGWSHGEQVSRLIKIADALRQIFEISRKKGVRHAAKQCDVAQAVRLCLAPTNEGAGVRYEVLDLESAIRLQFLFDLAGGVVLKNCVKCRRPFLAGPGHLRAHSRFCSPECQIKNKSAPMPRKRTARKES